MADVVEKRITIIHKDLSSITPLWNALDRDFHTLYLYQIFCPKGQLKGPYCHSKRSGRLHLISGHVLVGTRKAEDTILDVNALRFSAEHVEYLAIPNMTIYYILPIEDTVCLNVCDYPWSPYEPTEQIRLPLAESDALQMHEYQQNGG